MSVKVIVGIVGIVAICYLLSTGVTLGAVWLIKQLRWQFRLQSLPPIRHAPRQYRFDTMPVPIGDYGRHIATPDVAQNDSTVVLPPIDFEAETLTGPIRKIDDRDDR